MTPQAWQEVEARAAAMPQPPSALVGVAVGLVAVGVLLWAGHVPAAAVLLAVVAVVTVARRVSHAADRALGRVLARFGHLVGVALSWVTLGLTMLVVIAPVWLVSTVARWNVLEPGAEPGRWAPRRLRPWRSRPDRGFADDRRVLSGGRRWHGALTVLVPLLLVVALVPPLRTEALDVVDWATPGELGGDDGGGEGPTEQAAGSVGLQTPITDGIPEPSGDWPDGSIRDVAIGHRGDPWADDYFAQYFPVVFAFDPYLTVRQADRAEPYVNVHDRVRRSYVPAGAEADPTTLDVWFFGGSALFGQGQRDDHTIPSRVARLAEQDGVLIRAHNFGVSSYWTWQDSVLLAQMLSERPAPDVIVAYEGYNDVIQTLGIDVPMQVNSGFGEQVRQVLIDAGSDFETLDPRDYLPRTTERSPQNAATIYTRGAQLARDLAGIHGIPLAQYLQPAVWSRDLPVDDATLANIGADRTYHDTFAPGWNQTRALMAVDGVVDLGDSLDDLDQLVYMDDVHHNEEAARVVAEAMYEHLGPLLAEVHDQG